MFARIPVKQIAFGAGIPVDLVVLKFEEVRNRMPPQHWSHNRKHFYKYMTADTAKTVLQNGTLRWSSPCLFNDPFDVQFDLHIEYDRDKVAEKVMRIILDGYSGRVPIVAGNALGELLTIMRERMPGKISDAELRKTLTPGIFEGMKSQDARLPQTHEEIRAVIKNFKLLCFSEVFDNILMWAHYSQNHTGVVLELSCIEKLDSAWGAARPVKYMDTMPLLVDEERLVKLMSGEGKIGEVEILDNSIFVKAADWAYEREWRIAGGRDQTKKTEDLPFCAEEITAVYLGCRISDLKAAEIRDIVEKNYPHASLHAARKSARRFALEFTKER
jgi:hypothetical protein